MTLLSDGKRKKTLTALSPIHEKEHVSLRCPATCPVASGCLHCLYYCRCISLHIPIPCSCPCQLHQCDLAVPLVAIIKVESRLPIIIVLSQIIFQCLKRDADVEPMHALPAGGGVAEKQLDVIADVGGLVVDGPQDLDVVVDRGDSGIDEGVDVWSREREGPGDEVVDTEPESGGGDWPAANACSVSRRSRY